MSVQCHVVTFVGLPLQGGIIDGSIFSQARVSFCTGLALSVDENTLYFADNQNNLLRQIVGLNCYPDCVPKNTTTNTTTWTMTNTTTATATNTTTGTATETSTSSATGTTTRTTANTATATDTTTSSATGIQTATPTGTTNGSSVTTGMTTRTTSPPSSTSTASSTPTSTDSVTTIRSIRGNPDNTSHPIATAAADAFQGPELALTTNVTTTVALVTTVVAGSSTGSVQRISSVLAVLDCGDATPSSVRPPSLYQHALGFSLRGSSNNATAPSESSELFDLATHYASASFAALVVWVPAASIALGIVNVICLVIFGSSPAEKRYSENATCIAAAAFRARLPGALLLIAMIVGNLAIETSVVAVSLFADALSVSIATAAGATVFGAVAASFWKTSPHRETFRAVCIDVPPLPSWPRASRLVSGNTEWIAERRFADVAALTAFGKGKDEGGNGILPGHQSVPAARQRDQSSSSQTDAPRAPPTAVATTPFVAEPFLRCYGVLFEDFVPPRRWYGALDVFLSTLATVAGNVRSSTPVVCAVTRVAVLFIAAVSFVVLVALRPHRVPLDFAQAVLVGLGTVAAAALAVPASTAGWSAVVAAGCMVIAAGRFVLVALMFLLSRIPSIKLALRERLERAVNSASGCAASPAASSACQVISTGPLVGRCAPPLPTFLRDGLLEGCAEEFPHGGGALRMPRPAEQNISSRRRRPAAAVEMVVAVSQHIVGAASTVAPQYPPIPPALVLDAPTWADVDWLIDGAANPSDDPAEDGRNGMTDDNSMLSSLLGHHQPSPRFQNPLDLFLDDPQLPAAAGSNAELLASI